MSLIGNDPFSGSTVRNVLRHFFSPKILNGDGMAANVVKTDIINVDNIYYSGNLVANGVIIKDKEILLN
jgi:hypothetical protein